MAKKASASRAGNVFSGITMPDLSASKNERSVPVSELGSKKKEGKKRYNLYIAPDLYEDVQHIAFMQKRSMSEIVSDFLSQYRSAHQPELDAYNKIQFPE